MIFGNGYPHVLLTVSVHEFGLFTFQEEYALHQSVPWLEWVLCHNYLVPCRPPYEAGCEAVQEDQVVVLVDSWQHGGPLHSHYLAQVSLSQEITCNHLHCEAEGHVPVFEILPSVLQLLRGQEAAVLFDELGKESPHSL